jgi:hypothetical protein
MTEEEIKDGDILWTIKGDMESEGYGDYDPRKPHQVKAFWQNNPGGRALKIFCFNKQTGEIDDDSNASNYVQPSDVFKTKAETITAFAEAIRRCIQDCQEQIAEYNMILLGIEQETS